MLGCYQKHATTVRQKFDVQCLMRMRVSLPIHSQLEMGEKKAESMSENILQQLSNNHQYVIPIEVKDIKNDAKRYARFCFFFYK